MEKINLLFNQIINDTHDNEDIDNLLNYLNNYLVQKNDMKRKYEYYEEIIKNFFDENNVYYSKSSKLYFNYLDNNYIVCNEDSIIHYVLDFISSLINKSEFKNIIHIDNKKFIKCFDVDKITH